LEDTLSEIFTECWSRLLYGSIMADNAFHTGVVGTQLNGQVSLRTVVLRSIEPDNKQVIFYTDVRSDKIEEIGTNPNLSWLFYDNKEGVQLRLAGDGIIHNQDDVAAYHWGKVHDAAKRSYLAKPGPSTGISEPADGLEYLNADSDLEAGYSNFAVIITEVNFIEWLNLKDSGHRRAEFKLIYNSWKGQWLIP
jgi:pyridoxamine 5'-phosphate oxidase